MASHNVQFVDIEVKDIRFPTSKSLEDFDFTSGKIWQNKLSTIKNPTR